MTVIVPINDLRDTNKISQLCHESDAPVFVTRNGADDLVVMTTGVYDRLAADNASIDDAIEESEKRLASGAKPLPAKELFRALREKYCEHT